MDRARAEDRRFYDLVPPFHAMAATGAVTEGTEQRHGRRRTPSKNTACVIQTMTDIGA